MAAPWRGQRAGRGAGLEVVFEEMANDSFPACGRPRHTSSEMPASPPGTRKAHPGGVTAKGSKARDGRTPTAAVGRGRAPWAGSAHAGMTAPCPAEAVTARGHRALRVPKGSRPRMALYPAKSPSRRQVKQTFPFQWNQGEAVSCRPTPGGVHWRCSRGQSRARRGVRGCREAAP